MARRRTGNPDLLDPDQAAEYLGISRRTLTHRVNEGRLVTTRIGHRLWFLKADLDAYFEACRTVPKAKKTQRRLAPPARRATTSIDEQLGIPLLGR